MDRESVLILAPFVTLDAGTGWSISPRATAKRTMKSAWNTGWTIMPRLTKTAILRPMWPYFAGRFVFDANRAVIDKLNEVGALLGEVEIEHSYPHCWRCKKPIIFRSTEQWFISMEKNRLRENALKAINTVQWIPGWGKDRIYGMVENRPDWCISRQRLWGVPIAVFYCANAKRCWHKRDFWPL